jgi:hypothetical protein
MKSPWRIVALTLFIGIAGLAVAGSFAPREPDSPHASEVSAAAAAGRTSEAGVARSELPRLGTALLLGGGLVGLALLGRKRLA